MKEAIRAKAAELTGKTIEKQVASKAISINEENHTAVFVMSTESIDRHGDIVEQDSWKLDHFKENPAFFWGHRSNDFPLGKWLKVWLEEDPDIAGAKMLMGEAEFAVDVHPDIERAWNHVKRGDLNMVSVGFIPHVVDYDEEMDAFLLKSCELLECSLVGIGSNRRATIKEQIIEAKEEVEKEAEGESPAAIRRKRAAHLLNQAIRNL